MANVLELTGISKRFQNFVAVDGVDLAVPEGSFFSILGPSGCGKTTLLRMISGFLEPTSGSLKIRGENMLGVPPNKRPVNLVFQNLALFPMMNVAENIAFGLKRQRRSRSEIVHKVESILDRVGLHGYGKKRVEQLSGGQRQRVAIARSLVLDPSILLLDEPLGALDLKLREQMKIELKKLQAEIGTTFIYITHDQSEALVMSDQVAVMNKGRFEQVASPRELYASPQTEFVANFVGENNNIPAHYHQVIDNQVELCCGDTFMVTAADSCQSGAAMLYLRPEAIILDPPSNEPQLNYFSLTVRTILFDGSNTKILATIGESEFEISVALPQNQQFSHIKKGDTLRAAAHSDHCRCYGEQGGNHGKK